MTKKPKNSHLIEMILKYLQDNKISIFKKHIIKTFDNKSEALTFENVLINENIANTNCLNIQCYNINHNFKDNKKPEIFLTKINNKLKYAETDSIKINSIYYKGKYQSSLNNFSNTRIYNSYNKWIKNFNLTCRLDEIKLKYVFNKNRIAG
jgi:hypothetical protein